MNELDFYNHLRAEVEYLEDLSASSRGLLYRAAVNALEDYIVNASPPLSGLAAQQLRNALSQAIERMEKEFAEARETSPTGYPAWVRHPSLQIDAAADTATTAQDAAPAPDAGKTAARQKGESSLGTASPDQASPSGKVAAGTDCMDGSGVDAAEKTFAHAILERYSPPSLMRQLSHDLKLTAILLARHVRVSARSDKLAYFWLVMEPLLQVLLLISIYWFAGHRSILGMPIIPFAILGIGPWLMFRTMLLRISTGVGREWNLLYFPGIFRIHIVVARGIFYFISYFFSITTFILIYNYHMGELEIDDPIKLSIYSIVFWMFSMGISLVLMYIFHNIPTLVKSMIFLQRVIILISGAFFVTEQIPEEAKSFLLWNPLLHGIQLIRSAFFIQYETTDASPLYFILSSIIIFSFGIVCEYAMRKSPPSPT